MTEQRADVTLSVKALPMTAAWPAEGPGARSNSANPITATRGENSSVARVAPTPHTRFSSKPLEGLREKFWAENFLDRETFWVVAGICWNAAVILALAFTVGVSGWIAGGGAELGTMVMR